MQSDSDMAQEVYKERGIRIEDRMQIKLTGSESMYCADPVHEAAEALERPFFQS